AKRMTAVRRMQAQMSVRDKVGDALAELVEADPPEALVNGEMQQRLQDFAMRLQAQGMTLDQWLDNTGQDSQEFVENLREVAAKAAKFDLGLRAVAEAEELVATDEDLDAEFADVAQRLELEPAEVRKQFTEADQISSVQADIRLRKALDFLVETVEIVDEEGNVIDRADLEPEVEADDESDDDDAGAASVESPTTEAEAVEAPAEHEEVAE
ncbi:MAG TPA: hypothetical protein VIJ47_11965, partial [Acidimicrobiales bacterium]